MCEFFDFKQDGYFIDIGAFDGVHLSNSNCFEQLGWKGICVEPQSFYYQFCKDNRPQSTCIHAACNDNKDIKELSISIDSTGLFSGVELNTDKKNIIDHYSTINMEITKSMEETVPAVTLNTLIEKHVPGKVEIDFLSIDVEGFEKNVLKGLDLSRFKPRILLIETITDDEKSVISDYLIQYGYIFARKVGSNSFYVHRHKDIVKINSIEVTCIIEKQMHPLGREYTQQIYLDGKIIYKGSNGRAILKGSENTEKLLIERNQKASDFQRIINDITIERNKKVSELQKIINDITIERNKKVSELQKIINDITIERNKKVSELQKIINDITIERNKKVSTLLNIIKDKIEEGDVELFHLYPNDEIHNPKQ